MEACERGVGELLNLPDDALSCILSKVGWEDLLSVGRTCRLLHGLSNDDSLWMLLCKQWRQDVNLQEWRRYVVSAKALFRLLRYFSSIVGVWTARQLHPRGGILCISWGKGILVASRVLPKGANSRGAQLFQQTSFIRLFEILGLPDGSTKVELLTTRSGPGFGEIRLPGDLVWASDAKDVFHLEMFGLGQPSGSAHETDSSGDVEAFGSDALSSKERQKVVGRAMSELRCVHRPHGDGGSERRLMESLQQRFLLHYMAHGTEHQLIHYSERGEHERFDQCSNNTSTTLGQRALRYLCQLATRGELVHVINGGSQIWHSQYSKLVIGEPRPGQELQGLWSGIYGPHGLEVVLVSYSKDEIVATKILGDPNVPCGEVTFKGGIDTETTSIPDTTRAMAASMVGGGTGPPELVKMYSGHGRIADHNFRNPQWVCGWLLVDSAGNLFFLWGDGEFLIQFQRFKLGSL